jgi:transketolase
MSDKNITFLKQKSNWVRQRALEICMTAGGHLVSAFSCVEILVALFYGNVLRFNSKKPNWDKRDRFILSKGHAETAIYTILADLGFFSKNELKRLLQPGALLGLHLDIEVCGIEATTGSLGHGLGIGCGMAYAAKRDNKTHNVFILMGDGECSEGSVWESALFAGHNKLNNLIAIIDRNFICATDFTEKCVGLEPLKLKWEAFGWQVMEADGHSLRQLLKILRGLSMRKSDKPLMIIAKTTKGKGVSFFENDPTWHTRKPTGEQADLAKRELCDGF